MFHTLDLVSQSAPMSLPKSFHYVPTPYTNSPYTFLLLLRPLEWGTVHLWYDSFTLFLSFLQLMRPLEWGTVRLRYDSFTLFQSFLRLLRLLEWGTVRLRYDSYTLFQSFLRLLKPLEWGTVRLRYDSFTLFQSFLLHWGLWSEGPCVCGMTPYILSIFPVTTEAFGVRDRASAVWLLYTLSILPATTEAFGVVDFIMCNHYRGSCFRLPSYIEFCYTQMHTR